MLLLLGDFSAKSTTWFINDQLSSETQLESRTSLYEIEQLIPEPTHVLENSSSCIGLIFTNQPNFIMNAGIHPSLIKLYTPNHGTIIRTGIKSKKIPL